MKSIPYFFVLSAGILLLNSCGQKAEVIEAEPGVAFESVINEYNAQKLLVPEGGQTDIIYRGAADSVMTDSGQRHLSKNKIDFLAYVPDNGSSKKGKLFMNHELRVANPLLGDGGGMSWLEVEKVDGQWKQVGDAHHIDFSSLGGTWHNCGGEMTPHGTLLTAEEYPPFSNKELHNGGLHYRDTSDFEGLKRYENLGWMVEVDIQTKKPLHKLWKMGRYSHEDTFSSADGKTVYLTDDFGPCVFFKFEAEEPHDYTEGQLYAYKQSEDGESGRWLAMPMEMDSLIDARNVAIRAGATLFKSHEWVDGHKGKVYISETGGNFDFAPFVEMGGSMAHHLSRAPLALENYKTKDWFGRILVFDPATDKMEVFLEGGKVEDGGYLSVPDGLIVSEIKGKDYVFVCEDASVGSLVQAKIESYQQKKNYLELYMIPISAEGKAEKEGIKRLAVGPEGCELTGLALTPDKKTLFLTVQHPSKDNPAPYNTSTVVALSGLFE